MKAVQDNLPRLSSIVGVREVSSLSLKNPATQKHIGIPPSPRSAAPPILLSFRTVCLVPLSRPSRSPPACSRFLRPLSPPQHELERCKTVLQDYFKATFPKAAAAAAMRRQASLAAGRESPNDVMTMSYDDTPDHAKQDAMPIDSAPEFCFSPVR